MTETASWRIGPMALPPIVAGLVLSGVAHAALLAAFSLLSAPGHGERGHGRSPATRVRLTMPEDRSALDSLSAPVAAEPRPPRPESRPAPAPWRPARLAPEVCDPAFEPLAALEADSPAMVDAARPSVTAPPLVDDPAELALTDPALPMEAPAVRRTPSRDSRAGSAGSSARAGTVASVIELWQPRYPDRARRAGQEGTVLVAVEVLENGRCGGVRLHESSGHRLLDDAALRAATRCRFRPATHRGSARQSTIILPFVFELR